jgi:hypothetical protein
VPLPGDPDFDRSERRAQAKRAAAAASAERIAELRDRFSTPVKQATPAKARRTRSSGASRSRAAASPSINAAAVVAVARQALDEHPSTWTSYAELCAASGISRGFAVAVARMLIGEPTADDWFRIRNSEGVYNVPTDEAERGDASRYSREEADRLLESIGVSVDGTRADRHRKLSWTGSGWTVRA